MNQTRMNMGLGLRSPHYSYILEKKPKISWFEAISENYMGFESGNEGLPILILEKIRKDYPIVLHGVSLSIGSTDDLDLKYLNRLQKLIDRIEPVWVSDHICWTGVNGENLHDLLPLPYTKEAVAQLIDKILRAQDFLKRPLVFENVSSYLSFSHSEMPEWEFLTEVAKRTDCQLLIDINNIYVSSQNQSFDPLIYLKSIPKKYIKQFHLAGHSKSTNCLIDTHDGPVSENVWALYGIATKNFGEIPTLIEWDDQIPSFEILESEARKAEEIQKLNLKDLHENFERNSVIA